MFADGKRRWDDDALRKVWKVGGGWEVFGQAQLDHRRWGMMGAGDFGLGGFWSSTEETIDAGG